MAVRNPAVCVHECVHECVCMSVCGHAHTGVGGRKSEGEKLGRPALYSCGLFCKVGFLLRRAAVLCPPHIHMLES